MFGYYNIILSICSIAVDSSLVDTGRAGPPSWASRPNARSQAHISIQLEVVVGIIGGFNVAAVCAASDEDEDADDGEGGETPPEDV